MKKLLFLSIITILAFTSCSKDDSLKVEDFYGSYYMECTQSSSIFYTEGKLYEIYIYDGGDYCGVQIFGGYGVFSSASSKMYPHNYSINDNTFSYANFEMRGSVSLDAIGELYFVTDYGDIQVIARFRKWQ